MRCVPTSRSARTSSRTSLSTHIASPPVIIRQRRPTRWHHGNARP
jgi:hypothetical protein